MATLQELRDLVRTQLELDLDDLPNEQVDWYLREAFQRTIQTEQQWPFYAKTWYLGSDPRGLQIPADLAGIASLLDTQTGNRLLFISQEMAEQTFYGDPGGSVPQFFSMWGDRLDLWPKQTAHKAIANPDGALWIEGGFLVVMNGAPRRDYTLRGWRRPTDWIGDGSNPLAVVDADERLHLPLVHYAASIYKAFEEDDVMERVYLGRWSDGLDLARRDIMRPQHHRPLVFNGGLRVMPRRQSVQFSGPA